MLVKNVNLETVCGITSVLPMNDKIEIAFAGKSNVGKSSLINTLMNRKSYARISAQPGKTQTINFYNINDELYFVDLPGYGYAKVAIAVKEKWGKLIERYLKSSEKLMIIFLLIDIRHDPSENDRNMYAWITYNGYHPIIIATKLDKINRSQISKQLKQIRDGLKTEPGTKIIPFSALTKQGKEEIFDCIDEVMKMHEETAELHEEVTEVHEEVTEVHEEVTEVHEEIPEMHEEEFEEPIQPIDKTIE